MPEYGQQDAAAAQAPRPAAKDPRAIGEQLLRWSNSDNVADELTDRQLSTLGQRCIEGYEIDRRSRDAWEKSSLEFMDMALQRAQPKSSPWPNCSNIVWPLLSQATNEFAAAIYPVIMDGDKVVKGKIVGTDRGKPAVDQAGNPIQGPDGKVQFMPGQEPGAKRKRADRVAEHMSYQLLSEQSEWQEDSDRLFRTLPIMGCAARKSWFDPVWGRNKSMFVSMLDLVVNYYAKSLESAPRVTEVFELYPYEIEDKIRSEEYIDFRPGSAVSQEEHQQRGGAFFGDRHAPHLFLEQHCYWDLDDDGYEEPWTVVVHKQTQKVVAIRARFEADGVRFTSDRSRIAKIEPLHYYTLYQFMPNPESAIYGHGFGHILGPINASINSAINQMFDAGTLANMGGGFISGGMSMHSGALRFKMGEFKPINTAAQSLRDSIWQPQFPGPSEVMYKMFALLVEAGRELAGIRAVSTGQAPAASTDPMTLMAMMEQGMKVFKDVYKRVLRGLNKEYAKLFALNRRFMPQQGLQYQRADEQFEVTADDYKVTSGVETVGDPNMVTDMQKLMRAQVLGAFKDDPRCDGKEILRRIFEASNIEEIDRVVLDEPPPNPLLELELQLKQAEVASAIVTQQKDRAQSILYLMQARKAAADADAKAIDTQLEREWMAIEAGNQQIAALKVVVDSHKAKIAEIKARKEKKAA